MKNKNIQNRTEYRIRVDIMSTGKQQYYIEKNTKTRKFIFFGPYQDNWVNYKEHKYSVHFNYYADVVFDSQVQAENFLRKLNEHLVKKEYIY